MPSGVGLRQVDFCLFVLQFSRQSIQVIAVAQLGVGVRPTGRHILDAAFGLFHGKDGQIVCKGVVIDVVFVLIRTDDVFDFIALRIILPLYAACPETGNFNQKAHNRGGS